ncbi:hypothetical protein DYB32_010734 [Aphanomyces invadans]|uniref:Uncharacterized protein n=1 Tax=Aphanomyces invadans TaxID=157072 RepID=A0A3R6Y4E2_9STRA|nr:hypothetical protein DYB32_010734 [Aphanomyces invadans]
MESCSAFQYLYDPCSFECPAQRHTSYFTTTSRLLQPHQPASLAYRSRVGLYIGSGHHLVAHAALTQWRDNGASPRLECLRQVYPHMVAVVVVDALCFGPIDVLQYLHDQGWLRSFHQTSSIFSEVAAAILQPKSVQAFLQDHGYDVPWLYRSSGVGACFQRVLRCKRVARCIVGFQFGVPFALSFHSLVTPDSLLTPDERAWLDKHEHLSPQVAVSDAKRAPIWRYMTLGHHLNAHRLFTLRGTSHSNMKALMEAVIRVRDGALFDVVVVEVLAFGQVSLARWLVKHHRVRNFPVDAMDIAAAANNLSVLTYLHGMKYKCTTDAMDEAARLGHFEVVKFLHLNRLEGATKRAVDLAAANGHIEIVQYLLHRRQEGCTAYALAAARANGHVNIARFLVKSVARFQNAAPTRLDTLVRQAFLLDAFWTLIDSFQQGLPVDMLSLRPLRTLARRFCPKTVAGAASRNKSALRREVWEVHVEAKKLLLPWFQTYGCGRLWKLLFLMPETVDMVSIAALSGGRIDVVQYFHDHGHLFSFPGDAVAVARCHRHDAVSAFLYRCGYAQTCKTSNTPVCPCVLEWNVVHVVGIGLRQGADDRCGLVSKNRATTDVPKQSRVRHGRRTATGSRTSKLE